MKYTLQFPRHFIINDMEIGKNANLIRAIDCMVFEKYEVSKIHSDYFYAF